MTPSPLDSVMGKCSLLLTRRALREEQVWGGEWKEELCLGQVSPETPVR